MAFFYENVKMMNEKMIFVKETSSSISEKMASFAVGTILTEI